MLGLIQIQPFLSIHCCMMASPTSVAGILAILHHTGQCTLKAASVVDVGAQYNAIMDSASHTRSPSGFYSVIVN